jgi:biopolymer transport protein TolQ
MQPESMTMTDILSKTGWITWITVAMMFLLSIGVWTILLQKWFGNTRKRRSFTKWNQALAQKASLKDLNSLAKTEGETPLARVVRSALSEIEGLSAYVSYDSLNARSQLVSEAIERSVDLEKESNEKGLIFLAFCTATGPLIGLLGTVWGIMGTFFDIGAHGSANITVVAPGIAEALIAVLAGLVVAIPSSLGYNSSVGFNRLAESVMYTFGSELVSLFKRGELSALDRAARG